MISPASFNYYQKCIARATDLIDIATQEYTPQAIKDDLWGRVHSLLVEVPFGFLEID